MISGPKPKPTAIKKLGPRSHHSKNVDEPQPSRLVRVPQAPRWLGSDARAVFKEMARDLCALGVLTKVDLDALTRYCVVYERWRAAEKQLKKQGEIIKSPNGYLIQNPYLAIANKCLKQLDSLGAEFGLSPSSRTRVAIAPTVDERNKLEEELFGKPVQVTRTGRSKK